MYFNAGILSRFTAAAVLLAAALSAPPAVALEKMTMRVDWVPYIVHAPFHLAVAKGWYKEKGLDVQVDDGTGSSVTIQMVGSGAIDAGFAMQSAMAPGRDKGLPVKAIAGIIRRNDLGVIVPKDSGIKRVADLRGKRIITSPGGGDQPFIEPFLRMGGLSKTDVNLIYVAPSAKVSSYLSNAGDAVITLVPNGIPQVDPVRPSTSILFVENGLPSPSLGLIASDKAVVEREAQLRDFVAVSLRAFEYMLNGHEGEAFDALSQARAGLKLDRAYMLRMLDEYRPFFGTEHTKGKPFGYQAPEDWDAAIRTMVEVGLVSAGSKPQDFYTNKFIPGMK